MHARFQSRLILLALTAATLSFVMLTLPASAQRYRQSHGFRQAYPGSVAIGIVGGGNYNLGVSGPRADCNCEYDNGDGAGYHAGLQLDFFINRYLGLRLEGLFQDHSTEYITNRNAEMIAIDGSTVPVEFEQRSDVALQYITTSFSALWFTGAGGLYFIAGASAGFYTTGTLTEEIYLKTEGYTFPSSGTNKMVYKDGALEDFGDPGLRAAILLGIGFDLPLGRSAALAPELQANIPVTSVTDGNADWRINVIRASVALRFGI
ncbi:PorT family protein [bacterium]|nr:PorT family protein [bacterium]